MMLIRTYVGPSPIQGCGVFAAEPIPNGSTIWRIDEQIDLLFTPGEIETLPLAMREFMRLYAYPHIRKAGCFVLNIDNGRFMNHSDTPNTDFSDFDSGFAVRDIAVGEELTCNYCEFDPTFRGFQPGEAVMAAHARVGADGPEMSADARPDRPMP